MFKVVLTLKQVSIRLKQGKLDIALRKNKQYLTLCTKATIYNGCASLNSMQQFYVSPDDPKIKLVIYLFLNDQRRYGGDITLNLQEWQDNVIHSTQSKINNSPDKSSHIKYQFYYFKDDKMADCRSIFLASDKHRQQYNIIENSNKELNEQKLKLEQEVFRWHKRNEVLQYGRQGMIFNMNERENSHKNILGTCQESINNYSHQYTKQKEAREELIKLAQQHGINHLNFSKMQQEQ